MEKYKVFSQPWKIYNHMLADILKAKKSIYLETYIYDDDAVGKTFRRALIKKAKEGVRVRLLLDAWGSTARKDFFEGLAKHGGKIRYFREIRYVLRAFTRNHERNHRKLLIIDGKVAYLGSANITQNCLDWREIVIRIYGRSARQFLSSFISSWNLAGFVTRRKIKYLMRKGFEIIEDSPDDRARNAEKKYLDLIRKARKNIYIETPYFMPSKKIRKAFERAVKRGVKVDLILPHISDVKLSDIARNIYLGDLYKKGVNVYYYKKSVLHSKLIIVDDSFFIFGSSNLDYRSFLHQYEINLFGGDKELITKLKRYFFETFRYSVPFSYAEWKNRSSFHKLFEIFIYYIRRYL